jgi:hypothetical protein
MPVSYTGCCSWALSGERQLSAFGAYWDESGTGKDVSTLTVAGLIASPERWDEFAKDWGAALSEWKLPFFHMVDYCAGQGFYKGWEEPERTTRITRLIDIILDTAVGSVGITIPKALYVDTMPEHLAAYVGGPLGTASYSCMIEAAGLMRGTLEMTGELTINHMFEMGAVGQGKVAAFHRYECGRDSRREQLCLGGFSQDDKRKYSPLQAADILAWELNKYARNWETEIPRPYARASIVCVVAPSAGSSSTTSHIPSM